MWCKSFINNIILSTQTFAPIVWHYDWFASGTLRRINTFFWVTLRVGHLRGFWRWISRNLKRRDRAAVSRRCSICDDTCLAKSLPVLIRACYVAAHTKWPWSRCGLMREPPLMRLSCGVTAIKRTEGWWEISDAECWCCLSDKNGNQSSCFPWNEVGFWLCR